MNNRPKVSDKLAKTICPQLAEKPGDEQFRCECGQQFADRGSLYVHQTERPTLNSHLRPSLALRELPFPMAFTRPSSHALFHYKPAEIPCPKCPKKFKFSVGLFQHYGKVHESKKRSARCPDCGKSFKNKHAVKFHVTQVHSDGKWVQCEFCEELFYNKYVLQRHWKKCKTRSEATRQTSIQMGL